MNNLMQTLKTRTTHLALLTRDRGIDVLGKVRDGTLDWHQTLEARRTQLDEATSPRWFQLGGLQIFVIDRFDRALNAFGEKVREEIKRLQHLELQAAEAETTEADTAEAEAAPKAARKRAKTKAASARASKPKTVRAKTRVAAKTTVATKSAKPKAKAQPAKKRVSGKATHRFVMPIAGYDELTAKEVIGEIHRLTPEQTETVRSHEASHKKRKTVLSALDARQAS